MASSDMLYITGTVQGGAELSDIDHIDVLLGADGTLSLDFARYEGAFDDGSAIDGDAFAIECLGPKFSAVNDAEFFDEPAEIDGDIFPGFFDDNAIVMVVLNEDCDLGDRAGFEVEEFGAW